MWCVFHHERRWHSNITNLVEDLKDSARSLFKWFLNNQMQRNATNFHVLLSPNEKVITKVDSTDIENSQSEKLLGNTINNSQIIFKKHINSMSGMLNLVHYLV